MTITLLHQATEVITLNTVLSLPVVCDTFSLHCHKDEDVAYGGVTNWETYEFAFGPATHNTRVLQKLSVD